MSPWSLKKRMWVFSARPVSQSLSRMRPMFQSMFSTMAQAPAYSRRARSSRAGMCGTFSRMRRVCGLKRAMYSGGAR